MTSQSAITISSNASDLKLDNKASVTLSQRIFQLFQSQPQADHEHCSNQAQRHLTVRSTQSCHASLTALSVDEALRIISDQTPSPVAVDTPVTTSIIGSVIAEDVSAEMMMPPCHVSAVDGYAIVLEEGKFSKGTFPIVFAIGTDTSGSLEPLQPGTVARTTIGARLPPNANAVIKEEDTTVEVMGEGRITIMTDKIVIGNNVRDPGSYISSGSRIFVRGDVLTPLSGAVGLLAMAGVQTVKIFRKPRIGIFSMREGGAENNSPMHNASRLGVLSSLISRGFEIEDLGTVRTTMHGELKHAMSFGVDVLLILNGASGNELDFYRVIETLGGFIHFDRVPMKPSSHITFATIPSSDGNGAPYSPSIPFFSLPNDPASALVALNLFVLPSLNKTGGLDERLNTVGVKPRKTPKFGLPRVAVVLTHHIPLDPERTEYNLAVVTGSLSDARLYATSISTEARGGRDIVGGSRMDANALIILRAGRGFCLKGEIVEALLMGPCSGSDTRLIC
ncbi:hypothetical protein N7481_013412 [Penicillium waksmanii]|uniref:uncharacterized protein n=1 Tax=Penicillium waksmanii TaxID=69791 RepID=UPI0025467F10|nr:uncharacterized protein N7481_013412 [Penicillium waksmanii]KAJ5963107.1 hypothetical protein N7481_013412 [Penicillium waksmanii]